MKTKIQIKTLAGSILFEFEKEKNTLKDTLEKAIQDKAYLRGADLGSAYLRDADLRDADLRGAYLRDADLRDADLRGAYLRDADLRGADLRGAYLRDADLRGAYLRGSELRGAKNIPQTYINICSRDLLFIFQTLKHELPKLKEKLIQGQINGTQYEGSCACLIGSLAAIEGKNYVDTACSIPFYELGLHNPGEQWFYQIREGDTPKNNFFAEHAVKLIDMVLANKEVA